MRSFDGRPRRRGRRGSFFRAAAAAAAASPFARGGKWRARARRQEALLWPSRHTHTHTHTHTHKHTYLFGLSLPLSLSLSLSLPLPLPLSLPFCLSVSVSLSLSQVTSGGVWTATRHGRAHGGGEEDLLLRVRGVLPHRLRLHVRDLLLLLLELGLEGERPPQDS